MVRVGPGFFLLGFAGIVVLWPVNIGNIYLRVIVFAINSLLLALPFYYCSTPRCSFFDGLYIVSARMMTGCANISIFTVIPALLIIYGKAIYYSILGASKGRHVSGSKWEELISTYIEPSPQPPTSSIEFRSTITSQFNFVPLGDVQGQAFCFGCRTVDFKKNLKYSAELDLYSHEKCMTTTLSKLYKSSK